jgi:hypothetical protein
VAGRINEKIQKMKKVAYNPLFTLVVYPDIGHDHNRIYTAGIKKPQMDILIRVDVVHQRIPVRLHSPFVPFSYCYLSCVLSNSVSELNLLIGS